MPAVQPLLTCYRAAKSVRDQLCQARMGAERSGYHIGTGCPQPLLKKAFCQQEGGDHDAARTSVGFGPVSGPLHSSAHIRTAGARKSHVHP